MPTPFPIPLATVAPIVSMLPAVTAPSALDWAALLNFAMAYGPFVMVAVLAIASVIIKANPGAAAIAQNVADVLEEIEVLVVFAEKEFPEPSARFKHALDGAQAWLAQQGVVGVRGRMIKWLLPLLIEVSVRRMQPKGSARQEVAQP